MAYEKLQPTDVKTVTPGAASARITSPNTSNPTNGCVIWIGSVTGGTNVEVVMAGGTTAVIKGVSAGQFLPIQVIQVVAAGTTASEILAFF